MARTRVIYQSEAVYCSQDVAFDAVQKGTGAIKQLSRVQSANYSFSVARQDVNQFGNLAAIDQIVTESPTVSFDTSYYLANFSNEARLGFNVLNSGAAPAGFTSCIGNIIDSTNNAYQKNYYMLTTKEGKDANENVTTGDFSYGASIIGIGNGFLTSYSTEGAVGGLPTVSVSVEGQNMNFVNLPYAPTGGNVAGAGQIQNGDRDATIRISGENPAVSATDGEKIALPIELPVPKTNSNNAVGNEITTLRPGDITLSIAKQTAASNTAATLFTTTTGNALYSPDYAGASIDDAHIQSYTLSFDLSRSPIQKLGNRFAFARTVDFPITVSLSVDAVLSDLTSGSLADIINCDDKFDARISIKEPECAPGAVKHVVLNYLLKGMKLDSQSFSSDIGSNKSITLDFSSQIGGPDQFEHGVFMSGFHNA
jgi:hypothetical protein